ncbi:helix-turn-helix transcriptional regulator [Kitasatospora sp. NPDC048722]|uniref:helix-turn-helix transcriptional regulator n=1 Tax=Kitasatospora sp. NPDC048722 TaxID=3155639 RepID=UPI0033CE0B68
MTLSTLETLRLTVAALRQRTGENQRELAAALGLTQDKVSRRQSGAQPWSLDEVDALARHWGMGPLDLLAGPTHAAQSMTWPPGTAAPPPAVETMPATFAAAAPETMPSAPAEAAQQHSPRRPAPRRRTGFYTPMTPLPDGWTRPGERDTQIDAAPTGEAEQPPLAPAEAAAAEQQPLPTDALPTDMPSRDYDRGPDGQPVAHPPVPCEQCGRPVSHRIGGRALHLGGWCAPAAADTSAAGLLQTGPAEAVASTVQAATIDQDQGAVAEQQLPAAPSQTAAASAVEDAPAPPTANSPAAAPDSAADRATRHGSGPSARAREYAGTGRELGFYLDMIASAVEEALDKHKGDVDAASAALEKQAIPNAMELFDKTRANAVYEHTAYPERLEFLSKKSRNSVDEIWEGRHKWENSELMKQLKAGTLAEIAVDVLDTNAAYCSALKTHLPIGALQHRPEGGWDPKRSGIYLLPARPTWEHPHLPDPIGNRREAGPVLLDEATVRLLIRAHKLGLAEAPHITEAWTSGSSESLLEKFRRVLTTARENAIHDGDTVTEKYVKAMYAKFASTIGESSFNRDIRRPDWMHIIRSQAFANLWYKSHRAHKAGLTIVSLQGTDELHVTGGEWRKSKGGVFEEGRLTTHLKLKDHYTLPRTRNRSA